MDGWRDGLNRLWRDGVTILPRPAIKIATAKNNRPVPAPEKKKKTPPVSFSLFLVAHLYRFVVYYEVFFSF